MKYTTFITLLLLSLTVGATGLCQKLESQADDGYLSLGTFQNSTSFSYQEDTAKPKFSESLMASSSIINYIGEFDADSCEDALTEDTLIFGGHTLKLVYTIEDYCDGGNSYGYIVDESENGKIFATIQDSDIYCL